MPKTKGTTGNTFAALALPVLDTSDKDEIGQLRLRENIKSANEALAAANAEKSTFDKAKKTTEKHKEAILANADAQAKAIMQAARKQIEEINKKTQEEVDNLRSEDVGEERKIHNKVRVLEAQVNFLQAQLEALSPPPLSFATIRNELASAQSAPSPVHPTRPAAQAPEPAPQPAPQDTKLVGWNRLLDMVCAKALTPCREGLAFEAWFHWNNLSDACNTYAYKVHTCAKKMDGLELETFRKALSKQVWCKVTEENLRKVNGRTMVVFINYNNYKEQTQVRVVFYD